MGDEVSQYLKDIFGRVAEEGEFWIDTMEVMEDHVQIFVEVTPRYSPAKVVEILKSISARKAFKEFANLRKQLWAGELWRDGYFVRSVGDKVTADIIRKYIEYQTQEENSFQPRMFEKLSDAPQLAEG